MESTISEGLEVSGVLLHASAPGTMGAAHACQREPGMGSFLLSLVTFTHMFGIWKLSRMVKGKGVRVC